MRMTQTIYWYDLETTGIDPARDRAIQFAGVRTNMDLDVIGAPTSFFCYPGDDVIPSPDAMLVTGLKMSWLRDNGLHETEFIDLIHREFAEPQTCVAGFNSIRFDDEFVRHILYRNFIDPYAREWQGENSRWDLIDALRMAQALRPEGINWPRNESGDPTFRLELLSAANDISHESAHEATSDVLATIGMARKLKEAQPRLFEFLFNLRSKKTVLGQVYPLGKSAIVHASSMYSAARNCLAVVLPLCQHPRNTNGIICFDLAEDPTDLIEAGVEELHRRIFSKSDALDDDETRIPLKTIHVNRAPAIAPLVTLRDADAARLSIDVSACKANMKALQTSSGVVEKIQDAFQMTEFEKTEDPDLMLYQGDFFSNRDRTAMSSLREMDPKGLGDVDSVFDDTRVAEMIFRYRARNYPGSLSADEQHTWSDYRRDRWQGMNAINKALARIDELETSNGQAECLEDLRHYIKELAASVGEDA
jgi:exodeoxyribonuclease-1